MKRALLGLLMLCGCLVALSACVTAPVVPPTGIAYTNFRAPLDADYQATPVTAKTGRSSSTSILGLVATGDASAETAARDGGITRIESADYEYKNILGIYQQYTTVVSGQ